MLGQPVWKSSSESGLTLKNLASTQVVEREWPTTVILSTPESPKRSFLIN